MYPSSVPAKKLRSWSRAVSYTHLLKLNEDYFFCFGCGATGDVIDLEARLFNLSSYEAAQKLALDFGLDPKPPTAAAMVLSLIHI